MMRDLSEIMFRQQGIDPAEREVFAMWKGDTDKPVAICLDFLDERDVLSQIPWELVEIDRDQNAAYYKLADPSLVTPEEWIKVSPK